MGSVLGIQNVEEPAYQILHKAATYEIRRYGTRYAAKATYDANDDRTPFMLLAKYIGVFGEAENEGVQKMEMTAPVVKEGTKMAMTAPVVKDEGVMMFVLPKEFDSLEKIPKPTNNRVSIERMPSAVGAVKRYSGSQDTSKAQDIAHSLGQDLQKDGYQQFNVSQFQYWGYNPPFTLPFLRRNEVWIELNENEVMNKN